MNSGFLVAAWLLANVIAVGVYDVIAFFFARPEDEVSYWLQKWFMAWPMLAVALGVVVGHLCWPLRKGGDN